MRMSATREGICAHVQYTVLVYRRLRILLNANHGVTDASMEALKAGLKESGVVEVDLDDTGVSEGEQRAVEEICEANKTKREQAQAERS